MERLNSDSNDDDQADKYLGDSLRKSPESYRINKENIDNKFDRRYIKLIQWLMKFNL